MREYFAQIPIELVYGVIAIIGGAARYLNSFTTGTPFKLSIFAASCFAAGFSGWMFAILGDSMHLPLPMPHIMAGLGGFFGDQTMKMMLEVFSKRIK